LQFGGRRRHGLPREISVPQIPAGNLGHADFAGQAMTTASAELQQRPILRTKGVGKSFGNSSR